MKNLKNIPVVAMCTVLLAACASESSVANYAIGDDSVAIKAGRNRAEAQISCAELAQHRRQRQNVSEELALECEKCANKNVAIRQGMGTAAGGLMLLNGVVGTVGVLKSVF